MAAKTLAIKARLPVFAVILYALLSPFFRPGLPDPAAGPEQTQGDQQRATSHPASQFLRQRIQQTSWPSTASAGGINTLSYQLHSAVERIEHIDFTPCDPGGLWG
ncbi:hypothetical protein [Cupriavidus laharis]|uniref:hypothetical protein n=1 Tax=Cupriavidus laharis TaxID=151654 RepID=UPI001CC44B36|nr:hypothetical protein [Cupriavidus laharis]